MRSLPFLALAAGLSLTSASPARAVDLPLGKEPGAKPSDNATSNTSAAARGAPGELSPVPTPAGLVPKLEIHGGATLWLYLPIDRESIEGQPQNNLELYLASLNVTGRLGTFGIYFNPSFRDSEARDFFTSNVWVEQAYAFWESQYLTLKLGKIHQALSLLEDDTFYYNIPYFDGLKYDSNYGVSGEGGYEHENGFGVTYYGQYFLLDAGTNGSLRDRDTVWVDKDVHRHHTTVLRVQPYYRFNEKASLRAGFAAEYTYVDFVESRPSHVFRFSGDASFVYGPVRVFGEFLSQSGQTVVNFPIASKPTATGTTPGQASSHNRYALAGAEARLGPVTLRYAFSMAKYRDVSVTEMLHVPGITFTPQENICFMLEYVFWNHLGPGPASSTIDNSINLSTSGHF